MQSTIFNIQKFSLHDGPGIRTVVFFKGCPLRCLWCANPESQAFNVQLFWNPSKCEDIISCLKQQGIEGARLDNREIILDHYDSSIDYKHLCPHGGISVEGYQASIDDIMQEVLKDRVFYEESGGGVTLSGGEVLGQAFFATQLLEALKAENIHTAAETTGYAPSATFEKFIQPLDLLLYDLKHYDSDKHKKYVGVDNDQIIQNIGVALANDKEIIIRIPVIPEFNDSLEDAKQFSLLLNELGATKVNLLPFHQFGMNKYELMGKEYTMKDVKQYYPEDLENYRTVMVSHGIDAYF